MAGRRHRAPFYHHKWHIPSYRFWLYGFNIVLLLLLFTFVSITCKILHNDRLYLFPLEHSEPLVLYVFCGPLLQIIDILTGLLGIWRQKSYLLTFYWWFLLIIIFSDLIIGFLWIFRWRMLHSTAGKYFLDSLATQYDSPSFCRRWNSVQNELSCCGVYSISDWNTMDHFCQESLTNITRLPQSCCGQIKTAKMANLCLNSSISDMETTLGPNSASTASESNSVPAGCRDALIKWLYGQSNIIFLVGVCVVLFLKVVGLVIMRTEIRQLGDEIYARKNRAAILAQPKFSVDISPFNNYNSRRDNEMDLATSSRANGNVGEGRNRENVRLVGTIDDSTVG